MQIVIIAQIPTFDMITAMPDDDEKMREWSRELSEALSESESIARQHMRESMRRVAHSLRHYKLYVRVLPGDWEEIGPVEYAEMRLFIRRNPEDAEIYAVKKVRIKGT